MSKYKIGDKVRIVSKWNMKTNENSEGRMDHWRGKVMTIKGITESGRYKMREDEKEFCGRGWTWNEHCIAGLDKSTEKIVITTDGVETLARLYDGKQVVKSATAKCSPDDEFDFEFGAKLAMERLTEETLVTKKKANSFKVGDIVRIGKAPHKSPASNYTSEKYAGEYGRVIAVDNYVFVKMFKDSKAWYWNTDDVELIERNED